MCEGSWQPALGDVVWLASGSPPLTVEGARNFYVEVAWFSGSEQRRDAFPVQCLRNFMPEPSTGANGKTFAENLRDDV